MPRGMTFATIRRGGEESLAIKTDRGLLDVRKAESAFHEKAPTTIDEVIRRGGGAPLQALGRRRPRARGRTSSSTRARPTSGRA